MAFLGQTYAASDMPQGNNNYEPLPAGWYTADTRAGRAEEHDRR